MDGYNIQRHQYRPKRIQGNQLYSVFRSEVRWMVGLEEAQKEQTQLEALSQMSNQLKILIAVGIILAIGITFIGVSNLMCEPPCV